MEGAEEPDKKNKSSRARAKDQELKSKGRKARAADRSRGAKAEEQETSPWPASESTSPRVPARFSARPPAFNGTPGNVSGSNSGKKDMLDAAVTTPSAAKARASLEKQVFGGGPRKP